MMVWLMSSGMTNLLCFCLILSSGMTNLLVEAARPDPPSSAATTTSRLGSKRLDSAEDCLGVVAFSATSGSINNAQLVFSETHVNKGVGYAPDTGIFTIHCPGMYQYSFSGYGDNLKLTLKKKINKSNNWIDIVSAGSSGGGGGANLVILDSEAGDQFAVFVNAGKPIDGTTFTGYRIAKK